MMSASRTQLTWWAMRLADNVETCCSLLRGEPVDERALDAAALAAARERGVVVLCRVVDLFDVEGAT